MKHQEIVKHLQLVARDVSPVRSARIAAAIVYKGRIISIGVCSYKSHPIQKKFGKNQQSIYLHAEIDAISKAHKRVDLSQCSLYVVRVKYVQGKLVDGLAKPCEGCARAISAFNIRNIYYTEN